MSGCAHMCVCVCCECVHLPITSRYGRLTDSPAFTGTLRTIPRDIRVGYVTAIPKFSTTLNAEVESETWELLARPWPQLICGLCDPSFSVPCPLL